jgi:predicted nucleic acid-binding protein
MRHYLIDTGPLAAYLNGRRGAVDLLEPWIARREVATSIVVYGEIVEYFKGYPNFSERRDQLLALLRLVSPYLLSFSILERYADIRRRLRPPHGPGLIGDIDTLIAATALERGLTLVTMDSDFMRVPDLKLEVVNVRH